MTVTLAITGLGVLGPFGAGPAALAQALRAGRVTRREVDRSRGFHLPDSARSAGLVAADVAAEWIDARAARRMSLPSRLAVAAARMALDDAGLARERVRGTPGAVVLGTAFGPTAFSVRILDQVHAGGPQSVSPFLFMESVANVHAGQVALDLGLVGPNATLTQREAGTLLAVVQAAAYVRAGAAPFALAGGVEELAPLGHAALDRFRALSRGSARGEEGGLPFDAERDGFHVGEGAVELVLEPLADAVRRGARVRAVLRAAVRASDPSASAQGWGKDAQGLARTLTAALASSDVAPGSIDRVVSGASGSRAGDRLEAELLHAFFGASGAHTPAALPPVLAPKATVGEYGAGLLGAAVLAVGDAGAWPTPGFERVDPALDVRPHDGRALPPARRVLVSALAAGGAACWLVLDVFPTDAPRVDPER